jgi:hypothetical protein
VIVVHENRGLNPHIKDVTRRMALEGFLALAPDYLSDLGGTPEDEDAARDLFGQLQAGGRHRQRRRDHRLAQEHERPTARSAPSASAGAAAPSTISPVASPDLLAAVPYYGRQPNPEAVAQIEAGSWRITAGSTSASMPASRPSRRRSGRGRRSPDLRLRGRQPRLQQRHLGGPLRQGGGGPRVAADRRLPEGDAGLTTAAGGNHAARLGVSPWQAPRLPRSAS